MVNPLSHLPIRKQRYLENLSKGMCSVDAAKAAGYSEAYSRNRGMIETEDVKAAAKIYFQRKFKLAKIAKRINEGMDAVDTQFFAKDGVVTDSRDVVNYSERRQYVTVASQMAGYYTPKQDIEHTQKIDEGQLRRLLDIADKLSVVTIEPERLRQLEASHVPLDAYIEDTADDK